MDKRKNWNGSIVHWIYQKFRLVSAGEKARWKKKEKERRTIDTIVDKATHRETRRLMLFSHLSAKNPTRLDITSFYQFPRFLARTTKQTLSLQVSFQWNLFILHQTSYCVTVGKKYSYVKTVFFVNTTINLRNIDLSHLHERDLIKWNGSVN